MITPQNARKAMLAHVNTLWGSGAAAIAGSTPEIRWQGVELPTLPGSDKYWMRVSTENVTTRQKGHRIEDPGISKVVYQTNGFITLEIFAPMNSRESFSRGELLAELGQCMFMATQIGGEIWFRNPRIRPLNNDGTHYRWNVIADYQFDQVKGN